MKIKGSKKLFTIFVFFLCILSFSSATWADNFKYNDVTDPLALDNYGAENPVEFSHEPDADPYKGYFEITVKNTCDVAWKDFHFGLYQIYPSNPSTVVFDITTTPVASSTHVTNNWSVSLSNDRTMLDIYFNSDIDIEELVNFQIYTDNTDNHQPFGIYLYPTIDGPPPGPVPVPPAFILLGSGVMGLVAYRRKKEQK